MTRGFRPCEAIWFKLGKNRRSSVKNQLTQTDSALNADQRLSKNHGDLMFPDRVFFNSEFQKMLTIGYISIFHELYIPITL